MAQVIDGQKVADQIKMALRIEARKDPKLDPTLHAILVGDNPASRIYVSMKKKACEEVGFRSEIHALPETVSEQKLIDLINQLNDDDGVNAILVQLPLPKHINKEIIFGTLSPLKDVDCFHPTNMGLLVVGQPFFKPCTPAGILSLLETYNIPLEGKHAVIMGRSTLVGKPVALLLLEKNCTVTVCHSKTKNLFDLAQTADILVVAVGKPEFIKADHVKKGAVVIDVGIHKLNGKKIVGDVAFDEVSKKASWITPVPGGVGPMTIAMLLHNTYQAAILQRGKDEPS